MMTFIFKKAFRSIMGFAACLLPLIATSSAWAVDSQSLDQQRAETIVNAFNERPQDLYEPITLAQVHLSGAEGRVDVNVPAKFSYLVQVQAPADPKSPILLLPLATSRYTPTYYQTDEWWDANKAAIDAARKAGTPAPRQDRGEVAAWLRKMKLNTNPNVIMIDPAVGKPVRVPLQAFLQETLVKNFARDGYVTLYRGGEKAGELESLKAHQKPRGMRYWTPTANYAWRYARKNPNFLTELVDGKAPLFVFKVPVSVFRQLTTGGWPGLTLGSELTKNAHQAFDSSGVFRDHLYQSDYLGEGSIGAEIELRGNGAGSTEMVKYFSHAITIEELAEDRIAVLQRAANRLKKQFPERAAAIESETNQRIERTRAESALLVAVRDHHARPEVAGLLHGLPAMRPEIANLDFQNINSFVTSRLPSLPATAEGGLTCEALMRVGG